MARKQLRLPKGVSAERSKVTKSPPVDSEHLHVLLRLGASEQVEPHDAGVGEEGVQATMLGDGPLADRGDGLLVGGIRLRPVDLL